MATSSAELHENEDRLSEDVIDRHRAIVSLMEELEAVDWYDQRVAATHDTSLAEVLAHNRDEEIEHAAMNLEWLRRNSASWDAQLRTYLFTDQAIVDIEDDDNGDDGADETASQPPTDHDLGIGNLKGNSSL